MSGELESTAKKGRSALLGGAKEREVAKDGVVLQFSNVRKKTESTLELSEKSDNRSSVSNFKLEQLVCEEQISQMEQESSQKYFIWCECNVIATRSPSRTRTTSQWGTSSNSRRS